MKRMRIATPLLLGVAVILAACEQQATETGEMEDTFADSAAMVSPEVQLDSLRIRYEEAWNSGDMDAIGNMMTSEYQEVGPEGVMNYDEVIAMMSDSANMPPEGAMLSIETEVLEVAESGDVAYGAGVSTVTMPAADGQEMSESSRWVAGFKREDGEWKLDRLAFGPSTEVSADAMETEMADPDSPGDAMDTPDTTATM